MACDIVPACRYQDLQLSSSAYTLDGMCVTIDLTERQLTFQDNNCEYYLTLKVTLIYGDSTDDASTKSTFVVGAIQHSSTCANIENTNEYAS